jgi:mono/diheme cytochrome c family protein
MSKCFALAALVLVGAISAAQGSASTRRHALTPREQRGRSFAEARCAGCHAVAANHSSPNPESPSFEDIANRSGTTTQTLGQFLRNSHNYPAAMNFTVESARIRDLASYIMTLQKPGYRPAI